MSFPWLGPIDAGFPPTAQALVDPNGLLAAGGCLSSERLLQAYQQGIFPWFSEGQPLLWWTPNPRVVFFPHTLKPASSFKKHLRRCAWQVTFNQAFSQVIHACAQPRTPNTGTWLSPAMQTAYTQLHHLGFAQSVEVWHQQQLVGGLYGVTLGEVFFGESMFSRSSGGSKVALLALAKAGLDFGLSLIDAQVGNPHLFSLGASSLPRLQFEQHLQQAASQARIHQLQPAWAALCTRHYLCEQLI